MTSQFLILLSPSRSTFPGDATPEERATVGAHFGYLKEALARGELILAGRTMDENPLGLAVIEVESEEAARRFAESDPAIVNGVFKYELRPYAVALIRPA